MFAIGGDELDGAPPIEADAVCPNCGERHPVIYGKKQLPDGTWKPSNLIACVKCPASGKSYLVGVEGKDITRRFENENRD